jgi:polysaccharide pyruvyl transferase WcaK-like protein
VKKGVDIRFKIIVEDIHSNIKDIKAVSRKLNAKRYSNIFLLRFTKKDIRDVDEIYYNLKQKGVNSCFLPVAIEHYDGSLLIDGEKLNYDESYNLALFYHKILDSDEIAGAEKGLIKELFEIFSGKTLNEADIDLFKNGFEKSPALKDYLVDIKRSFWNRQLRSETAVRTVKRFYLFYKIKGLLKRNSRKQVFIFGWYGTETVGDKAILGGIVDFYRKKYDDNVRIIIGSLFPYITRRTVYELGIDAEIADTTTAGLLYYSAFSDEVVMGGGPLMDLFHLYVPYLGFLMAEKFNRERVVFGCGLGPLKTEKYTNVVKEILRHSTKVLLRDSASVKLANDWGIKDVTLYGDPAKKYIGSIKDSLPRIIKKNELACFLRDMPNSFFKGMSKEEFMKFKYDFEKALAQFIRSLAGQNGIDKIVFYHMHNFVVGGDDRDFSRYFINEFFSNDKDVEYDHRLSTVDSVSKAMISSKLNVCMRFHSVLFAETLDTDYVAVDYTGGGKIKAFLSDVGKSDRLYSIEGLKKEYLN